MKASEVVDIQDYEGVRKPTWCPGCGNYAILNAIKTALAELNIPPSRTVLVSGIGCGSRLPYFIRANGVHSLHGRPIAVAMGIKLVRNDLNVIVVAGDGDTYGIGTSHFIHVFRLNVGITLLIQNNGVFGLTRGQPSPTAPLGFKGNLYREFNPLLHALASGATFVARVWTGDFQKMKEIFKEAIKHSYIEKRGTSFVDIIQLCITYYPERNHEFFTKYFKDRVFYVDESSDYDITNYKLAIEYASMEFNDKIPMGIFYHSDKLYSLEEMIIGKKVPPGLQDISNIDVSRLLMSLT